MTRTDYFSMKFSPIFLTSTSISATSLTWAVLCLAITTFLGTSFAAQAGGPELKVNAERIEQHILALAEFGKNPEGGVSRVAFSEADIAGRKYIIGLMETAGLKVRVDTAGNLIGRRGGTENLPVIMFGSHSDSVPGGGNYDGDVGVMGAIEVAQVLNENGINTRHPLEVVVFVDEEGGLVGSRAMTGELSGPALGVISHSGLTIEEGIRVLGGNPERLDEARREPDELAAFVELHIEQGAILDDGDIDIGVVEGIVGIQWWDVTIEGSANHAGTTPMHKRNDALLAAAELIQAINQVITSEPGTQVGTVGRISATPGAPNVIPGKVVMSLEIRDLSAEKITRLYRQIRAEAASIEKRYKTPISFQHLDVDAVPAPTDKRVRAIIAGAAESLGLSYIAMPSGAGHDAQDMAQIAPTGMIFVPSVGGISHSPREFTYPRDMANGANVLLKTILRIDESGLGKSS